jgi:predicted SprT family Zn-dependent metalloprotease
MLYNDHSAPSPATPSSELLDIFQKINQQHFDGFLEPPVLTWNSRLRTSAGRFRPGRRQLFKTYPPEIEIASYLLNETEGQRHVEDTLAHEMIHYWLWIRRRPYGHTPEFLNKMKAMGCSRYNPVPKIKPPRYLYVCGHCQSQYPARKRWKKGLACLACCKKYSGGRFDRRFLLSLQTAQTSQQTVQTT